MIEELGNGRDRLIAVQGSPDPFPLLILGKLRQREVVKLIAYPAGSIPLLRVIQAGTVVSRTVWWSWKADGRVHFLGIRPRVDAMSGLMLYDYEGDQYLLCKEDYFRVDPDPLLVKEALEFGEISPLHARVMITCWGPPTWGKAFERLQGFVAWMDEAHKKVPCGEMP